MSQSVFDHSKTK